MLRTEDRLSAGTKGPISRSMVLALTLGLLAVLFFIVTAQAYVTKNTQTTLVDFDGGSFFFTGLLDIPPTIHSVQLIPIGLTGEWELSDQPLPARLANAATLVIGNRIYVVGGTDQTQAVRSEVYSARMSPELDGDLEPWQPETPLPSGRAGAGIASHPVNSDTTTLYVVGGRRPTTYLATDTIYRAEVDNNSGDVGTWVLDDERLPFPIFYASAVQHENHLYVVGGVSSFAFDRVDYAAINPDGSLDTFTETTYLPEALYNGQAVVYGGETVDTLYLIGGRNQFSSTFKVYFADFLPGGGLTPWQLSEGNLPMHLYGHSGTLLNGEIIVTGGVVDAVDPSAGISNTVMAALVDTENPSFRLYDWCYGVSPPTCTIGAWQTGALLPQVRSLHGTATGHGYVYAVGGQNANLDAQNTVFYGTVNGPGALHAPQGLYRSYEINLGQTASLRKVVWEATLSSPGNMALSIRYRYRSLTGLWSAWSAPTSSQDGVNEIELESPPQDVRFFQYQADLSTQIPTASPLLNWVEIYYEVENPALSVRKDTGTVISVTEDSDLNYTIYYTNSGDWIAEDAVLTESLPANTLYDGGPEWHRIGATDLYTYALGDLPAGASGDVVFETTVLAVLPEDTTHITNTVQINYPPMTDALNQTITDPDLDDNEAQWVNPVSLIGLAVFKDADPPPGTIVQPGSRITYTLYYTNTGTVPTALTVLTDTFDPQGDYAILSADPPPNEGNNVWQLGTVLPKRRGQIEVVVQVNAPLPNDWPVTNGALLFSPIAEPLWSPILTHTVMNMSGTMPAPMVDLVTTGLRMVPSTPSAQELVKLYASVANWGNKAADSAFWVEVYIKPSSSPPPSMPGDHEMGFCLAGVCDRYSYLVHPAGLPAGTATELLFQGPGLLFPAQCQTYDVYVQVDVADVPNDNAYWGHYAEEDETNNLAHLSYTTPCGPPRIYLPTIFRDKR